MVTYFIGFLAPLKAFDRFIPEGFTPVPLNQRHLTLVYLGSREDLDKLSEEVKAIPSLPAFKVMFKGLGAFPSLSKPRYLAALPSKESVKILERVRDEISDRIRAHPDKYSVFRPHVSVAYTRMKPTLELRIRVERAIRASRSAMDSIEIREFYLMEAAAGEVKPTLKLRLL
jgi:2'-5' RNA ligase